MTSIKTKDLTRLAIITALTLVLGKVFQFTMPLGFFTLLDVGIFFTAFHLGKKEGAIVGSLSGFLIDLISGYPQYMLISLVAHGLQGYFAGFSEKKRPVGLIVASLVMVGTYFLAETWMIDVAAALGSIIGSTLQNSVGLILGYLLAQVAKRFSP